MRWFLNISTKNKVSLCFMLMVVLLMLVIITGWSGIKQMQASQQAIYETDFTTALALKDIRNNQNGIRASLLEMILTNEAANRERALQDMKTRTAENDDHFKIAEKRLKDDVMLMPKLRELVSIRKDFVDTSNQQLPLIMSGKVDAVRELAFGIQHQRNQKMKAATDELINELQKRVEQDIQLGAQKVNQLSTLFITIAVIALAAAIVLTALLNRAIAVPLKELTGKAESIAAGDFTTAIIPQERRDEVGQLALAFTNMTEYLGGVANFATKIAGGDLRTGMQAKSERDVLGRTLGAMSDSLRKINGEIQEAVSVIAASASQILSSTSEVASSVTETAAAVVETTTTIEEVKQTAQVSSEKANNVAEAAGRAAQVSQLGRRAVDDMVEKMSHIKLQMESIADRIISLSEQSQSIGDIISTVKDLAEQSNLLAVNASIEAAKAGEHGKGFAVVAQEMRSLAEQSKQATAQVRTILNDIQKATGAAVLATEQGSKAVDEGFRQSAQAGESIRSLSASNMEAAEAASQIAASSQQQLVGMEQVINAMENIKLASEQNVAGTRQTETAAHSIHQLGNRLKELVSQYRV